MKTIIAMEKNCPLIKKEVANSQIVRLVFVWAADVITRAALPQNRVETLIDPQQAKFEITN